MPEAEETMTQAPIDFPFPPPRPGEPAAEWARLRRKSPVVRVKLPTGDLAWLVTGYADNRRLLTDPRFSRAATTRPGAPRLQPIPPDPSSLFSMDPPDHTRLRRLVSHAFTARHIETMLPAIERKVDSLLDAMIAQGPPADLVTGLGRVLPISVICELLGTPDDDHAMIAGWVDVLLSLTSTPPPEIRATRERLKAYLAALIATKRRQPGDDLITKLIAARDEDDALSEDELIMLGATMLTGGFLTTASEIGLSALTLLRHPAQAAALRADPSLLPGAIDELLRFNALTTGGGLIRIATEDVELGGVHIAAGEAVLPGLSSANRDESVFDDPDRFAIDRRPNPHLTFGLGIHYCLGAPLARLEVQAAMAGLLRKMPALRLAVAEDGLQVQPGHLVRGLPTLPVTW
jgi:cytochrome P450